jgi:hypothetical protein
MATLICLAAGKAGALDWRVASLEQETQRAVMEDADAGAFAFADVRTYRYAVDAPGYDDGRAVCGSVGLGPAAVQTRVEFVAVFARDTMGRVSMLGAPVVYAPDPPSTDAPHSDPLALFCAHARAADRPLAIDPR